MNTNQMPVPLNRPGIPPPFPDDYLPPVVREYVKAVAENLNISVDMPAAYSLAVLSLCCQQKVKIRATTTWSEELNMYVCIVADPSELKSPTFNAMIKPVKPKTEKSVRYIKLPAETMELLKQYREEYYLPLKAVSGKKWHDTGFVFISEGSETVGKPMHPDSVTGYCDRFSEKYGLKHINPHAFRHTAASLLYFAGMDTISISSHLGHAKASTTQNLYAHVMAEAESRIADCMGSIILTSRHERSEEQESNTKTG